MKMNKGKRYEINEICEECGEVIDECYCKQKDSDNLEEELFDMNNEEVACPVCGECPDFCNCGDIDEN